jgi:hypothetical protein
LPSARVESCAIKQYNAPKKHTIPMLWRPVDECDDESDAEHPGRQDQRYVEETAHASTFWMFFTSSLGSMIARS